MFDYLKIEDEWETLMAAGGIGRTLETAFYSPHCKVRACSDSESGKPGFPLNEVIQNNRKAKEVQSDG